MLPDRRQTSSSTALLEITARQKRDRGTIRHAPVTSERIALMATPRANNRSFTRTRALSSGHRAAQFTLCEDIDINEHRIGIWFIAAS